MMEQRFALFFIIVVLSGCAAYPKQHENILQAPIQFKSQNVVAPSLSKDDVVAKVKNGLQDKGLLTDKLAAQAVEKNISDEYDKIINGLPTADTNVVSTLSKLLSGNGKNIDLFLMNSSANQNPNFRFYQTSFKKLPENGFELKGYYSASGIYKSTYAGSDGTTASDSEATLYVTINGRFTLKDGVIAGSISKISYTLDCSHYLQIPKLGMRGPFPDVVSFVLVNEPGIVKRVQELSTFSKEQEMDVVSELERRMADVVHQYHRAIEHTVYMKEKIKENEVLVREKIKANEALANEDAVRQAKEQQQAIAFRKTLKEGDETSCGLVIERKNKIAKIQLKSSNSEQWIKWEDIYPAGRVCSVAGSAASANLSNASIGRKICQSVHSSLSKPSGVVLGQTVYQEYEGRANLVGFVEASSGNKIQIRISGMSFEGEKKAGQFSDRFMSQNIHEPMDGFAGYKGLNLRNGGVIWDDSSSWDSCI